MPCKPLARLIVTVTLGALAFLSTTHSWSGDQACLESAERAKQSVNFAATVARQALAVVSVLAIGQGTDWGASDEIGIPDRFQLESERASSGVARRR